VPDDLRQRAAVVHAYDDMMREQVAPRLREAGFTGTSRGFTIRRGPARGELRWQKDGRAVRAGLLPFTANIDYWCGRGRIADVLPAPAEDTWWELRDGEPTSPVAESVIAAVVHYVLPAMLAGLEEPDQVTDPLMSDSRAHGPGREPDGGGSAPTAAYVQPLGTDHDWAFANFTSNQPSDRLNAAYGTVQVPDDPRTVPALLDHLEHDPNPLIRKLIASRILVTHSVDLPITEALSRTAECDPHSGVRWAGRYALRLLQAHSSSA
jgi:hypothetical protein